MAISFYISDLNYPEIKSDTKEETLLAAFLSSDLLMTTKGMEIVRDKIDKIKKCKKSKAKRKQDCKKEKFPGDLGSLFMDKDKVEIRDNGMIFDCDVTYSSSFDDFVKIFNEWEKFVMKA